ncbi:hypothetical protein T484DRAFT_1840412 [Baffinella frigidus]|nr:hypothetical protein T484DRAFT_1840412 [Cryptophyta sp. CCMP2293]
MKPPDNTVIMWDVMGAEIRIMVDNTVIMWDVMGTEIWITDNTVIMWDVMGTEIRIDREKNFVDAEVAGMSLAGDKTSAQV